MNPQAASDVQTLFNGKARAWPEKYRQGGRLASRVEQFTARLSELCPAPGNILELGCGTGELAAAMGRTGYQVAACDIAENMLEVARRKWQSARVEWFSLKPDWTVLPFENDTFDGIIASSVFEYLSDVRGVAAELSRVVRPGGILIFSVPNPYNRTRKIESWLRPILLHPIFSPLFLASRNVKSYATYLRLSRNRFKAAWWKSALASAGFEAIAGRDLSERSWQERSNDSLILSPVKKVVLRESPSY